MSSYRVDDGVAIITLANPPVNALSQAVRLFLHESWQRACDDPQVKAIVVAGEGRGFSGGGDINEFTDAQRVQPEPGPMYARIEASPKPVVAATHGMALGGGLELALACHARVAHSQTQVGLPEVHLGLVPGAGGTQRLPRLIGLELALNLIVQGKTMTAAALRESGLFDQVIDDDDVINVATTLARQLSVAGKWQKTSALKVNMPNAEAFIAVARAAVKAQAKGLPAPEACIDCLQAAVTRPFDEGLALELQTFERLKASPQSLGLRHMFFAERAAANVIGLTKDIKPRHIARVGVIGLGTMGAGIAMSFANAGLPVVVIEREQAAVERGLANIRSNWEATVKKGRLTQAQFEQRMALVNTSLSYDALRDVDLVVEAAFEDMQVKQAVFEQLDAIVKPGAILASNTSTLDINQIAAFTKRPQDVLGLHFFSPANVMKLLEIVRGARTADEVLATAMALSRQLGKTGVISGVCDGFIGNRMLEPYMMQAGLLLDEGALPQQIDRAMEAWGMAMGPFRVNDLAGNDLAAKIRHRREAEYPEQIYSRSFDAVFNLGRFGQKTGRGWYDYQPGQRAPVPSQEVNAAIIAESQRLGLQRRSISDAEIVERLLLALVNEGARLLDEGIAQRASDIDVVYVAGYGFPRWRGGPMFQAQQLGLSNVLASLRRFANGPAYQHASSFWQPAPLLIRCAEAGLPLEKHP